MSGNNIFQRIIDREIAHANAGQPAAIVYDVGGGRAPNLDSGFR